MKGFWKSNLSGYDTKSNKRKSQNWNQYIDDNAVYNVKNDKYKNESGRICYFKGKVVSNPYGRLDNWNKKRQFVSNCVDRRVRARFREYVAEGNWEKEIKDTYGTKSIEYLVS